MASIDAGAYAVMDDALTKLDLEAEVAHQTAIERRAGGNLTVDAVARLLGISRQAVDQRRRVKTVLAIRQGKNWVYPRAQFHGNGTIPLLAEVIQGFGEAASWVALEFLVTGDTVLDGLTPQEALLTGNGDLRDRVVALVRGQQAGEGFA